MRMMAHEFNTWSHQKQIELDNNATLFKRLKRLPLPALAGQDNVADTWERQMKSRYQGLFGDRPLEQLAPGGDGLLRSKLISGIYTTSQIVREKRDGLEPRAHIPQVKSSR